MKVEYINPFIDASTEVLNKVAKLKVTRGNAYQKLSTFESDNLAVIIGVVGALKGQIIFSMNEDSALRLASAMMGGIPLERLDDMSKSAVAELANMISGNAMTIFSKKNINMVITPPTVLSGRKIDISIAKATIIAIPLIFGIDRSFEINVVLS
jgi:chemotaxis protein CheX